MRKALALTVLLLAACATTPGPDTAAVCPPSRDWHGWIDIMPGPREDLGLFVSGEVDVPAGMVAKLKPGPLDRAMPPGQRFALVLSRGKGTAGRQIITGRVRAPHGVYREIIVTCGGSQVDRIDGSDLETAD